MPMNLKKLLHYGCTRAFVNETFCSGKSVDNYGQTLTHLSCAFIYTSTTNVIPNIIQHHHKDILSHTLQFLLMGGSYYSQAGCVLLLFSLKTISELNFYLMRTCMGVFVTLKNGFKTVLFV